jgi:hypothetical protein
LTLVRYGLPVHRTPTNSPCRAKGRPVLTWTFDNINLPDSTRDQAGSNGFVKFTVLPVKDLPAGTRIENFADIYFDYNPPVRTNTVFNTLGVLPTEAPGGRCRSRNQFAGPTFPSAPVLTVSSANRTR